MARDRGASVVGLGALTAPASVGGKIFAKRQDIGVTNGNAFTAAMTMQAMERLTAPLGNDPLIAIVGATGSVGTCLTRLHARKHPGRLLLVARNERRLLALASDVRRDGVEARVSTDMVEVSKADLVVLLTSSPDAVLRSEHLKPGAIVLDDTVPRNTDAKLLSQRPDVLIVDEKLLSSLRPDFNHIADTATRTLVEQGARSLPTAKPLRLTFPWWRRGWASLYFRAPKSSLAIKPGKSWSMRT